MDPQVAAAYHQPMFVPMQSAPAIPPYQIALVKQTSLAEETVSRNGLTIPYHVVVKGAPFLITLRLHYPADPMNQAPPSKYPISFHNLALEITLLYDCETLKEVAFLKNKPVTFKPAVSEDGMEVTCQCRLKVLTSQHEGSFFRVRIRARPPPAGTKQGYPFYHPIDVITAPYKVISKPEQLKARQQQTKAVVSNSNNGKKRSLTEMLYDTVSRLEKQQQEHQRMLEHLIAAGVLPAEFLSLDPASPTCASGDRMAITPPSNNLRMSSNSTTTTTTTATIHNPLAFLGEQQRSQQHSPLDVHKELELAELFDIGVEGGGSGGKEGREKDKGKDKERQREEEKEKEKKQKEKEGESDSFEDLFLRCMRAYAAIDPDQRPAKIRRVMRNATTKQTEEVNEFVDLVYAEGLGRNIGGVDFISAFATGNNNSNNPSTSSFNVSSLTNLMSGNTGDNNNHNNNNKPQGEGGDNNTCTCANCPHKMELEKIDQFYSEFLN